MSLSDRVETAGMKGMAARQAAETHPNTANRTVSLHRFAHIIRTSGIEAARGWQQRRKNQFIRPQHPDHEPLQWRNRRSTSLAICGKGASRAFRRGLMTMEHCGFSRSRPERTASRKRRLRRFRTTADPSARGTVKPIRGPGRLSGPSSSRTQKAANRGLENRVPRSYTLRKSCDRSRRTRFGKPAIETTFRS
jgi:hypothetical protein